MSWKILWLKRSLNKDGTRSLEEALFENKNERNCIFKAQPKKEYKEQNKKEERILFRENIRNFP